MDAGKNHIPVKQLSNEQVQGSCPCTSLSHTTYSVKQMFIIFDCQTAPFLIHFSFFYIFSEAVMAWGRAVACPALD